MPKKAPELSALDVKRLRHPGSDHNVTRAVGGVDGLLLQITPTGARSWLLRAVVGGKRRNLGLGPFPDVTLAQARERARETREAIWQGKDPIAEKRQRLAELRRMTFSDALDRYCGTKLAEIRSEKHRAQWRSALDRFAVPIIGDTPVADLTIQDIQKVLAPIWTERAETARKLRGRIEAVIAMAIAMGEREGDNPARWKGNLDVMLPKQNRAANVKHRPALSIADAPRWFADLRKRDGIASRALEFLALTAARSGDVRGAIWSEVDLDEGQWTIPAARMKATREHRVPLSSDASELLAALPRLHGNDHVFPASRGGELSDMALSACMRRINAARDGGYLDARSGRPAVPHGLSSTFRDWAAERGVERELAEISLAHVVGSDVECANRRTDMLERRRKLMNDWAEFLSGGGNG